VSLFCVKQKGCHLKLLRILQFISLLVASTLAAADDFKPSITNSFSDLPQQLSSQEIKKAKPRSQNTLPISNIVLEGTKKQKLKLKRWLNDIFIVPKGYETLKAIELTGHTLTIKHSEAARLSSGRTIAPMTSRLTNGEGEDILIIFDAEMEDRGTHRVFGAKNELIEFNALQNLYHELAHAMHQMQGTWRYFASEKQAIEEENAFRIDLAKINGEKPRLRYRTRGVRITSIGSGGLGYQLPN
jgi:hypothetical protein